MTCTAGQLGGHDHSQPPHNTPDDPRNSDAPADNCQTQISDGRAGWCEHEPAFEVVVYSIGTHDWVRLLVCFPCSETMRRIHQVHSLRPHRPAVAR